MTSLSDYWEMLNRADWTYEMSDDQSVWRRGGQEMGKLERIARESPLHESLFTSFRTYHWGNWATNADGQPDYTKRIDKDRNEIKIPEKPVETTPTKEEPMKKVFRTGEKK